MYLIPLGTPRASILSVAQIARTVNSHRLQYVNHVSRVACFARYDVHELTINHVHDHWRQKRGCMHIMEKLGGKFSRLAHDARTSFVGGVAGPTTRHISAIVVCNDGVTTKNAAQRAPVL